MSSLTRTNLLLAVGVLLLGLMYTFEPGLKSPSNKPITALDVNQVKELKLYRQRALALSLKHEHGHWIALPPLPTDCANSDCRVTQPELLDKWLHFAELPSLHSFPAPQERLHEFGLEAPAYQLQLDEQAIFIGRLDPGSRLRYVLVDEQIHLVSDSYTYTLKQNPW